MKRILILLPLFALSLHSHAYWDTVYVRTAVEFALAIQSDRMIVLEGEGFSLGIPSGELGFMSRISNEYLRIQEVFDGQELVVEGVYKLAIVGAGSEPVHLFTDPQYGDVLEFNHCSDIVISNIRGGHYPEKGSCVGGVFNFQNCQDITIENCYLYGSGVQGIEAFNTQSLYVVSTDIYECTYYIMSLNQCDKVSFAQCRFYDNEEFDMVYLLDSRNVLMRDCEFRNNRSGSYGSFFSTLNSNAQFIHCSFIDNQFQRLGSRTEGLRFRECTFEHQGKTFSDFSSLEDLYDKGLKE